MDSTWAPQSPDLSSYHAEPEPPIHPQHQGYRGSVSQVSPFTPPASSPILQTKPLPPPSYPPMPRGVRKEESMHDADYMPDASLPSMADMGNGIGGTSALAPNTDHINIKNHFPVARIKRIMQADDDVGKVAQVTPVVVCEYHLPHMYAQLVAHTIAAKALELFMISLVTKAAAEAKSRNSKRVGALHLKQAITKNEQFDFLNDIVSKVADAPEKSESDAMDVDGKKKKTSSRKKKKTDDDDDF
ncbi:hypothetical protein N0V83_009678 [Neocucurbitaria cava]|uniref:Transcription factor CBF/NF-Y/archaeal histone domain-containing protein n=1 Tax=Neocucurbitaria cava TaxID=798079 RepID=A0A9W8XZI8_9PLEO|nr:hypothetical protein N0V83_009678 [Neocucurbitaria cava]